MLRKPIELPPAVAKAFVRDMKAFFKAKGHEADEIAASTGWMLKQHLPRGSKLRVSDVSDEGSRMRTAREPRISLPMKILYALVATLLLRAVLSSGFVPIELW